MAMMLGCFGVIGVVVHSLMHWPSEVVQMTVPNTVAHVPTPKAPVEPEKPVLEKPVVDKPTTSKKKDSDHGLADLIGDPSLLPELPPLVPKPEPKPEVKPEAKAEANPEPRPEPKPKLKPETRLEPQPAPVLTDGTLPKDVLERVKKSTALIRVTLDDNRRASGSGFFGVVDNLVLTNAHVVNMLEPNAPQPRKVEVVLNSGQPSERSLTAQIVGVDRTADLAVLRLKDANLPAPLNVHTAKELQETQQVYVCGFPLGLALGREVSIRKSSIASLRRENGELDRVQLEGGADPGNSGGPVIDGKGNVIGVLVSGYRGTTIVMAIPGDKVHQLLSGRASRVALGPPIKDGEKAKLAATVAVLDPMKRVQQVAVEVWTGDPGPDRPDSATAPPLLPTDTSRERTMLSYKDGTAKGEVSLAAPPTDKVHWVQALTITEDNSLHWGPATVIPMTGLAIEKTATTLNYRPRAGNLPLQTSSVGRYRIERGPGMATLTLGCGGKFTEVARPDNQGNLNLVLQYNSLELATANNNGTLVPSRTLELAKSSVPKMVGMLKADRKGNVVLNKTEPGKVPDDHKGALIPLAERVQRPAEILAIPLPNARVTPDQTWSASRPLVLDVGGKDDPAFLDLKYTYVGLRARDKGQEAVLQIAGVVKPKPGVKSPVSGTCTGSAAIDPATGVVLSANLVIETEMEMILGGAATKITATLDVKLKRGR
jgi:S1-C subfamily serine protease